MFVVLFLLLFEVEALVNPYGPTVVGDFTNCFTELIEFNFDASGLLVFANTKTFSTSVASIRAKLMDNIHSKLKFSVEVKSPKNDVTLCDDENEGMGVVHVDHFEAIPPANYFVVVIDTYDDFKHVANRIVSSRSWNPHAKIIILFFNFAKTSEENELFIELMLTCLFRQNAVNVAVVVPNVKNIRNAVAYSWRPFDPPKYCGYFNETAEKRLVVENTCEKGVMKHRKKIFEGKIPNNMNGCVLELLTLQRQPFVSEDPSDPNIERYFINQLAAIYGFKTKYSSVGTVRGEKDDTWNGGLKHLVAKEGHILLGGIFPDYDVHEDFEYSSTYLPDSYAWVVPRAVQSPKFRALFIIFKSTVWYCVMAVFCLCVISWTILGHLNNESLYHRMFGHCFLNTWISHVGFCAYARPVTNSLRVFYVFFNLYCILFLTAYQTKLIDVLKNPTYENQIDTIEELVQSGIKFGGFEELHDLFYNSTDPFDNMLGEKWIDIENITEAVIDVTVHRNFSVLCSRLELAHLSATVPELSDSSGDYKYFAFEENTFTVSVEMVSLRGFAYMRHFSDLLESFKQMGVSDGVKRYYTNLNSLKRANLLREFVPSAEVNPLTVQHLQGGFFALALGYISGTLVLFMEIIISTNYVQSKINQCKLKLYNEEKKKKTIPK